MSLSTLAVAFSNLQLAGMPPPPVQAPAVAPMAPPMVPPIAPHAVPPPLVVAVAEAIQPIGTPPLLDNPTSVNRPTATASEAEVPNAMPTPPTKADNLANITAGVIALTPPIGPLAHAQPPPTNNPSSARDKVRQGPQLDVSSYEDVFEGLGDTMFEDLEPPVYLMEQGRRQRLPQLDMSAIPHCSNTSTSEQAETQASTSTKGRAHPIVSRCSSGNSLLESVPEEPEESLLEVEADNEKLPPAYPGKGKGTGKTKVGRKASQELEDKMKSSGVSTRLRAKREKQAEERRDVKSGMDKLLATGE